MESEACVQRYSHTVKKDRNTTRTMKRLVCFMALFSIMSCLCVVVMTTVMYLERPLKVAGPFTSSNPGSREAIACIDCLKLVWNVSDATAKDPLLDMLPRVTQDGVEKCCAHNTEEMSALLQLTMRGQEVNKAPLPEYNVSNFRFSPVSAHKRVYPPKPYRTLRVPNFQKLVVTQFRQNNDPAVEHYRGVKILKDGIQIQHSGLYYLYSSIHFRPDSAYPCKDFTFQTWGHYIERLAPNRPNRSGVLMKTAHTCCDDCTMDEETSYTGGIFNLEENDVIRITVSGEALVYFRKQSSFAGLMMLGSANEEDQKTFQ